MTEAKIEAGAQSDPDNPPLTATEGLRFAAVGLVRRATRRSGMSVVALATALRLDPAALESVAAGDVTPDLALMSLLEVFVREPEAVTRSLAA